jgi:hypothetical protein
MINIPVKESNIPKIFNKEILSFMRDQATIGVTTGIIAIITALVAAVEYFSPKFSPRKYKKGLNKAEARRRITCSLLIFLRCPVKTIIRNKNALDITSLRNMVVIGGKYSNTIDVHMNDIPQNIMASTAAI